MSTNKILAEAHDRLQHLRNMPETPMRKREITALERLIEAGASGKLSSQTEKKSRGRPAKRTREDYLYNEDDVQEKPEKPLRAIERQGEHRRIIIRQTKPETPEKFDAAAEKKEIQQIQNDIKSTLGLHHRGFS